MNNKSKQQGEKDGLDSILIFSVAGIFICLIISILLYRGTFPGPLSTVSNDWSAIGSFFGGIFGPLVAFVTLIAILKTIRLQREMIQIQQTEFKEMLRLQEDTYAVQTQQLEQAGKSLDQTHMFNYKASIIRMLEQQVNLHQTAIERCTKSAADLSERLEQKRPGATLKQIEELCDQKEASEKAIRDISTFAIEFTLKEYDDIESLKKEIAPQLYKALKN